MRCGHLSCSLPLRLHTSTPENAENSANITLTIPDLVGDAISNKFRHRFSNHARSERRFNPIFNNRLQLLLSVDWEL
ncbi:hypothetical protein BRD01_09470 [Halobacteriales archaeon QS_8_65_32]|nr:MAG: hypothetical protein BRD01_09470 [Halobacteriales archaeon QS_8_65_32]